MKKQMTITAMAVLLVALMTMTANAQNYAQKKFVKNSVAMENLITGISSENEGLRRSSIYFAGYYKLDETVEALTTQLDKEENPSTRILIALSLFQIGNDQAMQYVKTLSLHDNDPKVQRMARAIYNVYLEEGTETYAITQPGM